MAGCIHQHIEVMGNGVTRCLGCGTQIPPGAAWPEPIPGDVVLYGGVPVTHVAITSYSGFGVAPTAVVPRRPNLRVIKGGKA